VDLRGRINALNNSQAAGWVFGVVAIVLAVGVPLSIRSPSQLKPIEGEVSDIRHVKGNILGKSGLAGRPRILVGVATREGMLRLQHEEFGSYAPDLGLLRIGDQITALVERTRGGSAEVWQIERSGQRLLAYEQTLQWQYARNSAYRRFALGAALVSALAFWSDRRGNLTNQ
jgi:hypothetical protein